MRNWMLSGLAAAVTTAALVLAASAKDAVAMPVAPAGQLGLAGEPAGSYEQTALICGPWTCYWRPGYWSAPSPYWSWRRHYWWGWHRPGWAGGAGSTPDLRNVTH
jgi:hypothetical protein